jgi:hypothetical protein
VQNGLQNSHPVRPASTSAKPDFKTACMPVKPDCEAENRYEGQKPIPLAIGNRAFSERGITGLCGA